MASLQAKTLTLTYGAQPVATDLSVQVEPGKITAIVGPNGCGKSTLLRALSRLLAPASGRVELDGKSLSDFTGKELAKVLGLLPQSPVAPEGITVADLVGRGRHPHLGLWGRYSKQDYQIIAHALEATGTAEFSDRPIEELSGGQRQRVWIAMALAQDTDVLLLDEPTTYLDVANQLDILDLLVELNQERGTTILMVLHDLNMAARYCDQLIAMRAGKIVAAGSPAEVVTAANMRQVFGINARVIADPTSGAPLVLPIGRHRV